MFKMDPEAIKFIAKQKLRDEVFEKEVAKEIEKLKAKKSLWDKVFPWKIKIERK